MTACEATPDHKWRPALYNQNVNWVYSDEYTKSLFGLLLAQPGERIVDMGCGTGELTLRLQELVGENGIVLGVDNSESMLQKAEANGVKNHFRCDIQNLEMPEKFEELTGTFDAVFTNATLHWCSQDPSGPVRAAKTLLKPGGRFVGEFCGHMTGIGIRSAVTNVLKRKGKAVPDVWFFPQPTEYAKVLELEGFEVEHVSLNPRITALPGSLAAFLRTLYRFSYLKELNDEEAEEVIQEVCDICEIDHKDAAGIWSTLYMSIRFRAVIPL